MKGKKIITIVITIVVLLASGISGYVSYGIFVNQSNKKSESTKNVKEKDKESAKPEDEETKKEEESVEPLVLTDEQKASIESAAYLYDMVKAEGDDRNNRQEYTYDCDGNQIPKDVLRIVAGTIACDNADDFGVEVREEPGYGETTLSTDQCIHYTKHRILSRQEKMNIIFMWKFSRMMRYGISTVQLQSWILQPIKMIRVK